MVGAGENYPGVGGGVGRERKGGGRERGGGRGGLIGREGVEEHAHLTPENHVLRHVTVITSRNL